MRHSGRLHKVYWDDRSPDPVVFPLQDAWYATADKYNRRIQPLPCKEHLQMLEALLLFYLEKDLPSMLAQFGQAKVGQNEDVLSTKVQLSLELLDLHLAELHAFRFFALERFPVLQVSTFSQQESTSLSLALTRLLQLFQRHLDEIAQFRKTCRGIDKLQKCDIFCGIADDMQDHVLMLAAKITVASTRERFAPHSPGN